ncbi:Panacea domain-containing protein [Trueperella bialowiezensis]|uniref:Uncharacterized phage-associated protein n=1 Tax=Trueperella bialowiezensis TaxID=312285 RepID=A0A448PD68_9ACTO|nr:type II toxin-antitoxin system antitoxin SocA domain-containing protein [Trueperella bialowiezensis]VEI12868.1 Uncharacterized phage-associated protein [Trueperella bialowiezensis]
MITVFDIASEFLDRAGGKVNAVKLQKLCFYAYGWFAHLTGEPLFGERFYAMQYGPVVGELLSAHAGKKEVDASMMQTQLEERDVDRESMTGYVTAILDEVWDFYGSMDSFELAEYSRGEAIWQSSWESRPDDSKRCDLTQSELVSYFLQRAPKEGEAPGMPAPRRVTVPEELLRDAERQEAVHQPFVDAIRALHAV